LNRWLIAVGIAAAAAVQLILSKLVPELGSRIDVFLILIAAVARGGDMRSAIVTGAIAGGIEDSLAGQLFGLNGFAKTLIGYLLASFSIRILVDHPLAIALSLAGSVIVNALAIGGLRFLLAQSGTGPTIAAHMSRALLTGLAGVVLAALARYPWRERWRTTRMRRLRS